MRWHSPRATANATARHNDRVSDQANPIEANPIEASPARRGWWRTYRSWPRLIRWTSYVCVVLVIALIAIAATGVVLVRRPFPVISGELPLPGLDAEVQVIRDGNGVPQLYGDSLTDLVRAQGYVHAQERFFEMDVRRHLTSGRLAEMFGEDALETDKYVRTMGWRKVAEDELALISPGTREALDAYVDGVNAYLDENTPSEIAVEYGVLRAGGLDYEPEPWTAVDSLAWLKAMAWDLRGNMLDEIDRVLNSVTLTDDQVKELYPEYPYRQHQPIVTKGAVVDGVFDQNATGGTRNPARPAYTAGQVAALAGVKKGLERMPALLGRASGSASGLGSNSWVVAGEHSDTGKPILANDPHLGVSQPGVWMQMGLHCREVTAACPLDVAGFTFSGVPGVVIGHNSEIAWGFTNMGPDVTDLYLEKIEGPRWLYNGRYRRLAIHTETIKVRGGDDFKLEIRRTAHGPLLSDVSPELSTVGANAEVNGGPERDNGYAVALAWTALKPTATADAILGLNLATNWDEFRAAAADFAVPAQNLVYADREGHIGYQAPGRIPIRKSGNDGSVPAEGWRPENDWSDQVVPFEALPHVLDPEVGFISTANQAVIGRRYPYYLTDDWDYGYRSQRIRTLIEDQVDEGLGVDDMTAMQLDTLNPMAEILTPYLLKIELPRGYYSDGQDLLADWDFTQPADSGAAAYYNAVWRNLLELTFDDDLHEDARADGSSRWFRVMTRILRQPRSPWWDNRETEVVETRRDVLAAALKEARDELTRLQALDPDKWEWGRMHKLNLRNPTLGESGVGPVEWLVNRTGYKMGGSGAVLNATFWDAREGYAVKNAPSMRMVVSLDDFDDSRWINLTGVSGHPFHDNYSDQTDLFVDGKTLPWRWSPDSVADAAEHTLTLLPDDDEE